MSRRQYLPVIALLMTSALWSSAFVMIKPMVTIMPPGTLALLRYGVAALIIGIIYLLFIKKTKNAGLTKLLAFLCGFIGIGLYNLALNHAEVTITAATTAFIISGLGPCVSVLFSVLCLGERPGNKAYAGMAFCVFGLIVMTFNHWGFNSIWGIAFAAISASCGGAFNALQKPLLRTVHPFEFMVYAIWGGFVLLLAIEWQSLQALPTMTTLVKGGIIYLAIFPAIIAYSLWSYGIQTIAVSKAVSALYLIPVFTALFSWLFSHTMPSALDWVGGAFIVGGAIIINNRKARRPLQD